MGARCVCLFSFGNQTKKQNRQPPKDIEGYYCNQLLQAKREELYIEQIFYLQKLSDLYVQKQNWAQAAKILNGALALIEKHGNNPSLKTYLLARLERIEALFLESKGLKTSSEHSGTVLSYRNGLKNIRDVYLKEFVSNKPILGIVKHLTASYKKLLGTLILDSQFLLGNPPVQWACIGMGSMARGEMCPYSDLEFAFLVEKKTEKNLEYFRTLSQLVELRIINIGETTFPIFGRLFGEKSPKASPTPSGFSMDSGGNTPLGKPGFYELIDTPQGLAQFQSIKWMETDIIVTNALSSVCYIAGDKGLLVSYNSIKKELYDKKDAFFKGIPFRQKLAIKLLEGNLLEFKPDLSKEKQETNAFGIKKELYRPLQSILSSLTLFCGLKHKSSFQMIEQLLQKKILSPQGAKNLDQALRMVLQLRFEAHTFYENEEEFLLHIEEGKPQELHYLYLEEERLDALFKIYKILIPFHCCGVEFLHTRKLQTWAKATLYDESPSVQGEAFSKTLQYAKAQEAFQQAVSLNPNDIDAQLKLGGIEQTIGKNKDALPRTLKALTLAQKKYGEQSIYVAICYHNIGHIHNNLGKYDQALKSHEAGLKIKLNILGQKATSLASSYHNLGITYNSIGKYDMALNLYQKALDINILNLGENHHDVGAGFCSIGNIYHTLGEYNKSLSFFKKALKVGFRTLGENHPAVATVYNCIGAVYLNLPGQCKKAFEFHQHALNIRLKIFGENHPDVATSYNNIGTVYIALEDYTNALDFLQKASKIFIQFLGENHTSVAQCYNNMGLVSRHLAQYDRALEYYQKALKIKTQSLGENHSDIGTNYNNIGFVLEYCKDYEKALECYQKALAIWIPVLGENHPDVATCCFNMGTIWKHLGNHKKALELQLIALKIRLEILGKDHTDVAASYCKIGEIYSENLQDYKRAIEFFQEGLKVHFQFPGKDHPLLVILYKNIGVAHRNLGNYGKSLEFYNSTLEINLKTLGENHLDTIACYNSIGLLHKNLGNYKRALEYYNKSVKISCQVLGEKHPNVATCYNNISLVYDCLGDYAKALEFSQNALTIRIEVLNENHPELASSYYNIGLIHKNHEEYDKALSSYQIALNILIQIDKKNHPHIEGVLNDIITCAVKNNLPQVKTLQEIYVQCTKILGMQHQQIQQLIQIIKKHDFSWQAPEISTSTEEPQDIMASLLLLRLFENLKALELAQKTYGENHLEVAKCHKKVAKVFVKLGKHNKAVEHFQKELEIKLLIPDENHLKIASCYNSIGSCFDHLNQFEKALNCLQKALAIRLQLLGESHKDVALSYNNIANIYYYLKDYDQALDYFKKTMLILLQDEEKNKLHIERVFGGVLTCAKAASQSSIKGLSRVRDLWIETFGNHHPLTRELLLIMNL